MRGQWLRKTILPVLPILMTTIGLVYIFADEKRTVSSVAYDVHRAVMPIQWWGFFFLVIGVAEAVAAWRRNLQWMVLTKAVGAGFCFCWALMLVGSLLLNPDEAPLLAPLLFGAVGAYHLGVVGLLLRNSEGNESGG